MLLYKTVENASVHHVMFLMEAMIYLCQISEVTLLRKLLEEMMQ